MKLSLEITATQLVKGLTEFAGQPVPDPQNPRVIMRINSTAVSIAEDMWLVEYHDGTKEVWNTEEIKKNTRSAGLNIDLDEVEKLGASNSITPQEVLDMFFQTGVHLGKPEEPVETSEERQEESKEEMENVEAPKDEEVK